MNRDGYSQEEESFTLAALREMQDTDKVMERLGQIEAMDTAKDRSRTRRDVAQAFNEKLGEL